MGEKVNLHIDGYHPVESVSIGGAATDRARARALAF
jgi:hypothetical protein